MVRALLVAAAALALAPAAHAGGPTMLVGVTEDAVKQPDLVSAKAKLDLVKLAGFDAVRVTTTWAPGETAPTAEQLKPLRNLANAALLDGVRVFVSASQAGSRTTPLTDQDRADFAAYSAALAGALPSVRDFIVGNEPNLNRFWLPQFDEAGADLAAPAYEALLAQTYDALKAVSPQIAVIGGAVSPRGVDKPNTGRDTHSPTTFIPDMGAAYRASGRTAPIMDEFAFHPYGENSSTPPTFAHPLSTSLGLADYDRLVSLLGQAFDGTAQPGSTLPILYDEYGVETQVPADRATLYTGVENATTKPVSEATQADYYRQAIAISFCQPNVRGLLLFHLVDEPALDRWQSGLYYANDQPKTSLAPVRDAALASQRGVIARCQGLALTPKARVAYPRGAALVPARGLALTVTCDIDCVYHARLQRLPAASTTLATSGRAVGRVPTRVAFPRRRLARGSYRFSISLVAPMNPGEPLLLTSRPFTLK